MGGGQTWRRRQKDFFVFDVCGVVFCPTIHAKGAAGSVGRTMGLEGRCGRVSGWSREARSFCPLPTFFFSSRTGSDLTDVCLGRNALSVLLFSTMAGDEEMLAYGGKNPGSHPS